MDRNSSPNTSIIILDVALRKESVDRNAYLIVLRLTKFVALRKESVDRNFHQARNVVDTPGRSPQGERG